MQLHKSSDTFTAAGIRVAAISLSTPDEAAAARGKSGLDFQFLADPEGEFADLLGLRHTGGNPMDGTDIARPANVLIDAEGHVLFSSVTDNYRVRPTPEEILSQASRPIALE